MGNTTPEKKNIGEIMAFHRMGSAPGRFTNDCSPFEILQVISEFFCCGESIAAGQNIQIHISHSRPFDIRLRPELPDSIFFSNIEAVKMCRFFEKVTGYQLNHIGVKEYHLKR